MTLPSPDILAAGLPGYLLIDSDDIVMFGEDTDTMHSITTALDNLNLTKALVDFPVNVSVVPVYHLRLSPWTLW
ncbi:unnamed protein product [Schistosoma mattheei]|uniref:Uncharacterized protein n=1 Tax=Schistosoma mattheei TaxID=31246 RepID=A0A183PLQ3_9TREM|nr:unnamed protein product [Schistosoma mattheei]